MNTLPAKATLSQSVKFPNSELDEAKEPKTKPSSDGEAEGRFDTEEQSFVVVDRTDQETPEKSTEDNQSQSLKEKLKEVGKIGFLVNENNKNIKTISTRVIKLDGANKRIESLERKKGAYKVDNEKLKKENKILKRRNKNLKINLKKAKMLPHESAEIASIKDKLAKRQYGESYQSIHRNVARDILRFISNEANLAKIAMSLAYEDERDISEAISNKVDKQFNKLLKKVKNDLQGAIDEVDSSGSNSEEEYFEFDAYSPGDAYKKVYKEEYAAKIEDAVRLKLYNQTTSRDLAHDNVSKTQKAIDKIELQESEEDVVETAAKKIISLSLKEEKLKAIAKIVGDDNFKKNSPEAIAKKNTILKMLNASAEVKKDKVLTPVMNALNRLREVGQELKLSQVNQILGNAVDDYFEDHLDEIKEKIFEKIDKSEGILNKQIVKNALVGTLDGIEGFFNAAAANPITTIKNPKPTWTNWVFSNFVVWFLGAYLYVAFLASFIVSLIPEMLEDIFNNVDEMLSDYTQKDWSGYGIYYAYMCTILGVYNICRFAYLKTHKPELEQVNDPDLLAELEFEAA